LVVQGGWEPEPRRCIIAALHRIFSLSLPKTPSAGVTAASESEHDCG